MIGPLSFMQRDFEESCAERKTEITIKEFEELLKENKRLKEENLDLRHMLKDKKFRRNLKKYYKTSYKDTQSLGIFFVRMLIKYEK